MLGWYRLRLDPERNFPWLGAIHGMDVAKFLGGTKKKQRGANDVGRLAKRLQKNGNADASGVLALMAQRGELNAKS